jgi:hypothetical protein
MFVAKCGGIKLNEDVFKEINGVITLSTESEVHDPVTSCGQLWDSNIFSVGKVEDRYIISMATRHAEANNIFPLDEIDGEYTVNVSASGYVAQEVQVTADEDQILTITLAQE